MVSPPTQSCRQERPWRTEQLRELAWPSCPHCRGTGKQVADGATCGCVYEPVWVNPLDKLAAKERRHILGVFCAPEANPRVVPVAAALNAANLRLLRLRYLNNLTHLQIAHATGSTEGAVAKMHGRVLDKMLDELGYRNIFSMAHI